MPSDAISALYGSAARVNDCPALRSAALFCNTSFTSRSRLATCCLTLSGNFAQCSRFAGVQELGALSIFTSLASSVSSDCSSASFSSACAVSSSSSGAASSVDSSSTSAFASGSSVDASSVAAISLSISSFSTSSTCPASIAAARSFSISVIIFLFPPFLSY